MKEIESPLNLSSKILVPFLLFILAMVVGMFTSASPILNKGGESPSVVIGMVVYILGFASATIISLAIIFFYKISHASQIVTAKIKFNFLRLHYYIWFVAILITAFRFYLPHLFLAE